MARALAPPRHSAGRFLYLPWHWLQQTMLVRQLPRREPVELPAGWYPVARVPDRNAVFIAPKNLLWLARCAWWIDDHKWDGVMWCVFHDLMWMEDGDYFDNARWRFPWRKLPNWEQTMAILQARIAVHASQP